jgi:ArsR family transcriptional regulator
MKTEKDLTDHINVWLYVHMKEIARLMSLLSDQARLRILMLLMKRELCVCQIMGVLGISQPLVSHNLALIDGAGFITSRKEGKLVFYSLRPDPDPVNAKVLRLLRELLESDRIVAEDGRSLRDCEEFQKKTGRCDMETFSKFMERRRKGRARN